MQKLREVSAAQISPEGKMWKGIDVQTELATCASNKWQDKMMEGVRKRYKSAEMRHMH